MLPDGREEIVGAKLGQTVLYTKAVIHERFDLPMEKQVELLTRKLLCKGQMPLIDMIRTCT